MDEAIETTKSPSYRCSVHPHSIRVFMLFAAAGLVTLALGWDDLESLHFSLVLLILLYAIVSSVWIKHRIPEDVEKHFNTFTTIDAIVIGVTLNFLDFALLPSALLAIMVQFNSLATGGLRKWGTDIAALAVGVAFSSLVQEPQWMWPTTLDIGNASLIAAMIFFGAYAYYIHSRMRHLANKNEKLINEQVLYKLRTYKLARYLTPTVWKAINEGREKSLRTGRKRVTVFFSDIRGFSTLSEEIEAENLTDLLNSYLTEMAKIVIKHKGTIDKFMGDAIMVIFGDAESAGPKTDCLRSLAMAIEMRRKMKELQHRWYNQGIKKPLQIRMGINTGYCTVGSFGTSHYMDYTVLGTNVNLASRLESAAQPGEILISHETWSLVKDVVMCRDKGEIKVKGFSHPVKVYQVVDFRKDLGTQQTYFEENAEGFSMHMDLEKIRNYDKDRVIEKLQKAVDKLRDKVIS